MGILLWSSQDLAADEELAGLNYWNELKAEAVVTESGLQYKALIMGKGRKPGPKSKVKVHYRGLFLNGVTFDTSFDKDEPVELMVRKVIDGWKEGIRLMSSGSVFVFLIPPDLAYGEKGSTTIPSNSTLIFEIELFSFKN
jgi:FKBP-type peptidyl-prolyl cis-trans isomerase FkpA